MAEQAECWEVLSRELFPEGSGFAVVYGEAGSGKTAFSLTVATMEKEALYINTEGYPTYERALQMEIPATVEFTDISDEWGLIYDILKIWRKRRFVIVDSINSVFRVSASYDIETAFKAFSLTCSLLKTMSKNAKVLATAQVSLSGDVPSGDEVLKYYSTSRMRLIRVGWGKEGKAEINGEFFGMYRIEKGGFKWISCRRS
jgi:RecA/RadA recombinase